MLRLRQEGDDRLSDKNTAQKLQKLKESLTSKEKVHLFTVVFLISVVIFVLVVSDLYLNNSQILLQECINQKHTRRLKEPNEGGKIANVE